MGQTAIGWIGLGIMGGPMARNLLRAGFDVVAYNRSAPRLEDFVRAGGRGATSPADVARRTDVVVTMVSDTPDVEQVVFGSGGVVEGARAGQRVIDMSTISPRATRDFAARLRSRGVDMLDAPVSGGESGAVAATLSIMVGGDRDTFDRSAKIFAALGKRVTHMGPSGSGQATKLVNQVAVLGNLLATCEALHLASACGLDGARVLDAVGAGAGASWQVANLGPKILAGDFAPGFPVRLARKDLRLVLEAVDELRLSLPLVELVERSFAMLAEAGGDDLGTQALAKITRRPSAKPQ